MIFRWHDDNAFIDQEFAATDRELSKHTVRNRLRELQVACDVKTRAPLYDHEQALTVLEGVRPRPARCAGVQRARRAVRA
ncbi:hypothetical protein [Actinoplanes sp. URMC 104]|uniref:hypothetical protein n=1 Tax=Actinoplanes sp. URMC 104 TaxID=3423409 RepID=UPI003F1B88E8